MIQELKISDKFYKSLYSANEFREKITSIQNEMLEMSGVMTAKDKEEYVNHTFLKNQYIRDLFIPKGEIFITKIHKVEHPFFLLTGEISILSEIGKLRVSAPYYGITKVGTKRGIYAHKDSIFVTVHPTDKKDLNEIEDELIAKNYKELEEV